MKEKQKGFNNSGISIFYDAKEKKHYCHGCDPVFTFFFNGFVEIIEDSGLTYTKPFIYGYYVAVCKQNRKTPIPSNEFFKLLDSILKSEGYTIDRSVSPAQYRNVLIRGAGVDPVFIEKALSGNHFMMN